LKQQLNLKREGPWRKWWGDTKALWNQRFGKNPSVDDLQRALNYRFVNREGMGTVGKFGPLGETGIVRPMPTVGKSEEERKSKANPLEGYRKVNVVKADGSREEVYFNDKYYDMGEMGKFASVAKITPEGSLTHGALKKGETIEEIPSERKSEAGRGLQREDKRSFMTSSERVLRNIKGAQSSEQVLNTLRNKIPPAEWDVLQKGVLSLLLPIGRLLLMKLLNGFRRMDLELKCIVMGWRGRLVRRRRSMIG
jgi:hypothetical protein